MHYITTPIYYVNDAPHLGHAYTTVIADALARWHRLRGTPTRLVTGTDEHGLKVQRAATAAEVPPAEWATATAERFRTAWDLLGISYDVFQRTTAEAHHRAVTHLLNAVRPYIYLDRYTGRYCVSCEAYVAEDTCPVHKRPTEVLAEENYFFRLSAFADVVGTWLAQEPTPVTPPARRNEALALVKAGLTDFSISRTSISWGIPLPWDPKHVTYVWFDALCGYLTAAGYPDHLTGWPGHHVIGKDILRFHAVYWPAMLAAAGLPAPARVHAHGFLLVGGEKMAKTGIGAVSPADLVARFGVDGLRYHLLATPFGPDGDFSYEAVLARYNADLANTLGNLVSRLIALVHKRCGGIGPAPNPNSKLSDVAARAVDEATEAWESVQPSAALAATWRLVAATNSYLVAGEPWRAENPEPILGDCLEALRIAALLAWPAIPTSTTEIRHRLGLTASPDNYGLAATVWGVSPASRRVHTGPPLFPRLVPS